MDRLAARLARDAEGQTTTPQRQRIVALQRLDEFATGAILTPLLYALDDPSPQVRRETLRMCFERAVVACVPGAATLWSEGGDPTVRVAALRVLSLDPEPSSAALLIEALRDPSELIRTQAADELGAAPLTPEMRRRTRSALLAKLADLSVSVRHRVVLSLGLIGPGEGVLSIARLLDDPEPTVRAAAAETLGRSGNPIAIPALRRAIATPNEASVARAVVDALATMPDPSLERDLLALLDDPPEGLDPMQMATAIGRRPRPGSTLLDGLVERLDEPDHREAVLRALLLFGPEAQSALETALARGLAPHLVVDVERLLAAFAPPSPSPTTRWPDPSDRIAWRTQLDLGAPYQQQSAAWALAQLDPAWRVPHARAILAAAGPMAGRRAWVFTLGASPHAWPTGPDSRVPARLEGWARDRRLSPTDRCLALSALGAQVPAKGRHARPSWRDTIDDVDPRVRACTALALGRQGHEALIAPLLLDPQPRVRVAAALGLAVIDPARRSPSIDRWLARLALDDPSGEVRAAAAYARDSIAADVDRASAPGWFVRPVSPYPWGDPPRWVEAQGGSHRLWLPIEGSGPWRWALIPGMRPIDPRGDTEVAPTLETVSSTTQQRD